MSRKKNIYLIIGASSDIGLELVRELDMQEEQATFFLHYHSDSHALEELKLKETNQKILIQADLSESQGAATIVSEVEKHCDAPTHIVNLPAAKFSYCKLKNFDRDAFVKKINIQVLSFVEILQSFLPVMAKRKEHDKIVSIISSYVIGKPPKFMEDYIMEKYLLLGFMKALAADYEGKEININSVSPSMIETKFLNQIDDRIVQMNAENSAESRNASVSDIVPAIVFLLSDAANYMHGVNLNLSNGNSMV